MKNIVLAEEGLVDNDIMNLLPHRYPFLLVDKIVSFDVDEGYLKAQKNVSEILSAASVKVAERPKMCYILVIVEFPALRKEYIV